MKRRIVKETYKDGTVKFRVEKYRWFSGWCIETKVVTEDYVIYTREPL